MDWEVRLITSPHVTDDVLNADVSEKIAGFATLRLSCDEKEEGVLFAVAPWLNEEVGSVKNIV